MSRGPPDPSVDPGFFILSRAPSMLNRILFFIDGFNLYHALQDRQSYHKYKWIDYSSLAKCYVVPNDKIVGVLLFTAYAHWNPEKEKRHRDLITAVQLSGVEVVFGKFKNRDRRCSICGQPYRTFEEKYTDVNIAIRLFQAAIKDEFDTAMLITADSDLLPAIKGAKLSFPEKQFGLVAPIGRSSLELKNICDFRRKMREKHLRMSQLPDTIILDASKGITLKRPSTWI